jgi:RNA polymerase sigma-70 factor (ECF subfamily)
MLAGQTHTSTGVSEFVSISDGYCVASRLRWSCFQRTPMPTTARTPRTLVAHDKKTLELGLVELLPELRGRACRLSGDPITADDIVQDTVERALKFSKQYERGTNLRAWVYQILFSVFITRYRRSRRDRNALRALAGDPCAWTMPERFSAPDASVSLTTQTQVKLDALPETFRTVLKLVDLDELTYREAASELGVPVGTVMSRLHRGRKLLASQLESGSALAESLRFEKAA